MTDNNCKPNDCSCIPGVVCDVKNCVHHDGQRYCSAEQINVGPNFAVSSADTACATFRGKQQ